MDYSSMSKEELLELKATLEVKQRNFDDEQMATKILLNSLYGAVGNETFRYYSEKEATAITISGQTCIKWAAKKIDAYLSNLLKVNKKYVIYGDTDSVVGSSVVEINGERDTIENWWGRLDGKIVRNRPTDEVKSVEGYYTPSVSRDSSLEVKSVKYIMRHKVKKRLYKISVNGESVTVTEDHSIILCDPEGKTFSVKPADIFKYPESSIFMIL